jgi:hypothetical protein
MKYSANDILLFTSYRDLFSDDQEEAKKQRKALLGQWHPDINSDPKAEEVFIHINKLFALPHGVRNDLVITVGSQTYNYIYAVTNNIYSLYYLTDSTVLIQFHHKATELKENFMNNLRTINFRIEGLGFKDRYKDFLSVKLAVSKNDEFFKVSFNTKYLPLTLLIDYIQDYKDWRISAWIISRLYDESLMFNHSKLNFTGGDLDMIFVDTETHRIIDLSALFFSTSDKMIVLSPNQIKAIYPDSIKDKTCYEDSSNSLIKMASLRLSGDNTQSGNLNLVDGENVNADLIKHINAIDCSKSLHDNYIEWQEQTIKKVFTSRSFYKKELSLYELKNYA